MLVEECSSSILLFKGKKEKHLSHSEDEHI